MVGDRSASQQSAGELVSGHDEEADRPGCGPGPSQLCGEGHGSSAGVADSVRAVGGASAQSPGGQVRI